MANLSFRYGAMGSGKSTALMQVTHNYKSRGFKTFVVKPRVDTKGNDTLVSRIGISLKVDLVIAKDESFYDHIEQLTKNIVCILVDEAQFLTEKQVIELWKITKEYDVPVICYGIRTNFKGHLFEGSKALFELSDEFEELATVCECGKKARFNARLVDDKYTILGDEVVIDGAKNIKYNALCGKCFLEKVIKEKK